MFEQFPIIMISRMVELQLYLLDNKSVMNQALLESTITELSFQASFQMTNSVKERLVEVIITQADDLNGLLVSQSIIYYKCFPRTNSIGLL